MEIIKERSVRVEKEYYINFDCKDDTSCGFIFPANPDESPALDKMPEEAKMNYFACEASTNKFNRWFEERDVKVVEPAIVRYYCLVMTEQYIRNHFDDIKAYANVIENRLDDEWCTMESVLADNAEVLSLAQKHQANCIYIEDQYEINIDL